MRIFLFVLLLIPMIAASQSSDLVKVTQAGNQIYLSLNNTMTVIPNGSGSRVTYSNTKTFDISEPLSYIRDTSCNLFISGNIGTGSEILISKKWIDRVVKSSTNKASVIMNNGARYDLLQSYASMSSQLLEASGCGGSGGGDGLWTDHGDGISPSDITHNVGIWNINPIAPLDVTGSETIGIRIRNTSEIGVMEFGFDNGGGKLVLRDENGVAVVQVTNDGASFIDGGTLRLGDYDSNGNNQADSLGLTEQDYVLGLSTNGTVIQIHKDSLAREDSLMISQDTITLEVGDGFIDLLPYKDSIDIEEDSILVSYRGGVEIKRDTVRLQGDGISGGGWLISSSSPADTLRTWVDRTTWDSTTVFEAKEYVLGDWKTIGFVDTVNYVFSSQPPIYVVITGQSNATPRAGQTSTVSDTIASPLTTIWNGDSESWTALHTGKQWMNGTFPNRSVWWGITMGKDAANRDKRIVKIVYAGLGGLTISNWLEPDGTQWDTLTARITDSNIPRIDAVVWYQGETDGWTDRTPAQYSADWFTVMGQFQALPEWNDETKVLAVQINTGEIGNDTPGIPDGEMANTVFNHFDNDNLKWTYVVKNDDAVVIADSSHIDARSHVRLGKRIWGVFTGKTQFNPIQKFDSRRVTGDSIALDFQYSAIEFRTEETDTTFIKQYTNWRDGWTGFLRVINDNVSVIPPDAQMWCNSDAGVLVEIDTLLGKYVSPGYLRNDTLILSQCPVGGKFVEAVPIPLELGVFAWYDASQEDLNYYNAGDEVTTLHDFSGNDHDFTNTGTPLLKGNALNGKPSILFNSGNTDYFTHADTTFSFLHYDSSTVVVVFNPGGTEVANPDSLYILLSSQSAAGSTQKGYSIYYDDRSAFSNIDKIVSLASNGSGLVFTNPAVTAATAGSFHVAYHFADPENGTAGNRSSIRVDDGVYSAGNVQTGTPSVTTQASFEIGRVTGATPFYFTGEIAEILIWKQQRLNTVELGKLYNYLNRKYSFNIEP